MSNRQRGSALPRASYDVQQASGKRFVNDSCDVPGAGNGLTNDQGYDYRVRPSVLLFPIVSPASQGISSPLSCQPHGSRSDTALVTRHVRSSSNSNQTHIIPKSKQCGRSPFIANPLIITRFPHDEARENHG